MLPVDQVEELKALCQDAKEMSEGSQDFVLLPGLRLPSGCTPAVVDGLLCPHSHEGYPSRLFVSEPISGKGNNWKQFRILDRLWNSPSWNYVSGELRLMEMLAAHLRAYR